jgi:hypothetical protein
MQTKNKHPNMVFMLLLQRLINFFRAMTILFYMGKKNLTKDVTNTFGIRDMCISWKVIFEKLFFKFFYVYLSLKKLINGKHFPVKGKFSLVSRKVFSWKIWTENTFRKLWKIKKRYIIYWFYQIWSSNFWLLYIFCFEYLFFNFIS